MVKDGVNMLTSSGHVDMTSFALTLANSLHKPVVYLDFINMSQKILSQELSIGSFKNLKKRKH